MVISWTALKTEDGSFYGRNRHGFLKACLKRKVDNTGPGPSSHTPCHPLPKPDQGSRSATFPPSALIPRDGLAMGVKKCPIYDRHPSPVPAWFSILLSNYRPPRTATLITYPSRQAGKTQAGQSFALSSTSGKTSKPKGISLGIWCCSQPRWDASAARGLAVGFRVGLGLRQAG